LKERFKCRFQGFYLPSSPELRNHPSGNLNPSQEDLEITVRLKKAGDLLGIRLLDHLVFSEEGYVSLLETNQF